MNAGYLVQEVGTSEWNTVRAYSRHHAVALSAGCNSEDVGGTVWRRGPRFDGTWIEECYMPMDNTGRQWIVKEVTR